MIETMMAAVGGSRATRAAHVARAQRQHAAMLRRTMGLAIVSSGFAVLAAEALQRTFGG